MIFFFYFFFIKLKKIKTHLVIDTTPHSVIDYWYINNKYTKYIHLISFSDAGTIINNYICSYIYNSVRYYYVN